MSMISDKRNVRIGISAKQTEGDESYDSEPVSMNVICDGVITEEDGNVCIEYEEHLSKDGEVTRTKLFWKKEEPKSVSMFRTGEVSMACLFSSGERCACSYKTQDLTLEFFIVTKSVKNTLSLSGGSIGVSYNMEVKGITVSRNEYKLTVIK